MEERGGAGQHKGAGSCGLALGRWRITGWGVPGGQRGGRGVEESGGWRGRNLRVRKPEQELGWKDGEEEGCEGETAQHKKASSWSGLF